MEENKFSVKFDYLSVTFPLECDEHEHELMIVYETVQMVAAYLNLEIHEIERQAFANNRFKYQFMLGNHIILRLAGPLNDMQKKTCQLELKGEGCRDFERRNRTDKSWMDFILWLVELNAKFRRVDIAIDDFAGSDVTMSFLLDKLKRKYYTCVFQSKPKPIGTIEDGLTIQMGSNKSLTELVIYDKLIEQQKRRKPTDKDYWVRYEMRFRDDMAERIIYHLCKNYMDLEEELYGFHLEQFACEQLYRILDIKKDNNYSRENQKNAPTDPKWLNFLHNVQKGSLEPLKAATQLHYQKYFDNFERTGSLYIILKFLQADKDPEMFQLELLKSFLRYSDFDKQKFFKMNMFLEEMRINPLKDDDFELLKEQIKDCIEGMELPF